MVNHFDGRRVHRRMLAQEVRALIVGRKHDGAVIGSLLNSTGNAWLRQPGFAAEPGEATPPPAAVGHPVRQAKTIGKASSERLSRGS